MGFSRSRICRTVQKRFEELFDDLTRPVRVEAELPAANCPASGNEALHVDRLCCRLFWRGVACAVSVRQSHNPRRVSTHTACEIGHATLYSETLTDPDGEAVESRFLLVEVEGKKRLVVLPGVADSDFLTPNVLRSLCFQAGLDLGLFGFELN